MSSLWLFVAAAAVACGCGGNIGGLVQDAASDKAAPAMRFGPVPDAGMAVEPLPDGGLTALPDASCMTAWSSLATPVACDTPVRACVPEPYAPSTTCGGPGFRPSLNQELGGCGIMCAPLIIGVAGGCVTDVLPAVGAADTSGYHAAVKCAFANLVGTRWDCAPPDGRYQLVFGVCLTPLAP
jgi:hypothetical protein